MATEEPEFTVLFQEGNLEILAIIRTRIEFQYTFRGHFPHESSRTIVRGLCYGVQAYVFNV